MTDPTQRFLSRTSLTELRDSCLHCVRKHLSQALILMHEVKQGYPRHRWLAVGHMGEAADEALKKYPKLAAEIRHHRLKYMANADYSVPIMDLLDKASKIAGDLSEDCVKRCDSLDESIFGRIKAALTGRGRQPTRQQPARQTVDVSGHAASTGASFGQHLDNVGGAGTHALQSSRHPASRTVRLGHDAIRNGVRQNLAAKLGVHPNEISAERVDREAWPHLGREHYRNDDEHVMGMGAFHRVVEHTRVNGEHHLRFDDVNSASNFTKTLSKIYPNARHGTTYHRNDDDTQYAGATVKIKSLHGSSPNADIQTQQAAFRGEDMSFDKIMFWSEEHHPHDYQGCIDDVYVGTVDAVLSALKEGETHAAYKGWADCQICGKHLGSRDLSYKGFVFPEMAEHYVEEHGVWTPGLERFARALNADLVEEVEVDGEGSTTCGIFIPIPFDLAKDFPDKSTHDDSVPHFTILFVGACSPADYKRLCQVVCRVARRVKPFSLDLRHYGEFLNKEGQKIAHMRPGLANSLKLGVLHDILRRELEKEKIKVSHSYGPGAPTGKKMPYAVQFKAHATLAYLPPMQPYRGAKPTGSWRVTELEVWGHEKHRIPLGMTHAAQPIGLDRDPLIAIEYPKAVPDVVRGKKEKTAKIKMSGSRIRVEAHHEQIAGGKARFSAPGDFDPHELSMGIAVEKEHLLGGGYSKKEMHDMAREIAMDHLKEIPDYYTRLKRMEKSAGVTEAATFRGGGANHPGLGGSSGDIGLDGSLPYFEQQKAIERQLRRKKLAGL